MLKYITIRGPSGDPLPIVFHSHLRHCDAVPSGATPISAGFILSYDGHLVIPDIGSDTLGLSPRPGDLDIVRAALGCPNHTPSHLTP